MASIEKRGKNSWRLVVEIGYDANGKRLKRSKTIRIENAESMKKTDLKKQLDSELSKFKIEVEAGEYIAPEKMTFAAFVGEWRTKHAVKHLEPTTVQDYDGKLKTHIIPEFGHMRLENIKAIHIISFLDKLSQDGSRKDGKPGGLSGTSRRFILRVLKDVLDRAVDWQIIKSNPAAEVKKPKLDSKVKDVLIEDEILVMFEKLADEPLKWRVFFELAITTGMRRGELLAIDINKSIKVENDGDDETYYIDVQNSLAKLKKNNATKVIKDVKTEKSKRLIAITPEVIPLINKLANEVRKNKLSLGPKWEGGDDLLLFGQWNGLPMYPDSPNRWFSRFLKRHKLNDKQISPHNLRHSHATYLLFKGYSIKEIQERLGHSDIRVTGNLYTHYLKELNKKAAGAFSDLKRKSQ